MFRNPTTDLIVVLVIVLLIFGPKRLPGLGKQLGTGLREFKESITGENKDEEQARGPRSRPPPPRRRMLRRPRLPPSASRPRSGLRAAPSGGGSGKSRSWQGLRPIGHDDRLSIVDHLDELRSRLFVCLAVLVVAFGLCFWQNNHLLTVLNRALPRQLERRRPQRARVGAVRGGPAPQLFTKQAADATALANAPGMSAQARQAYLQEAAAYSQAAKTLPDSLSTQEKPITIGVGESFTTTLTVAAYFALLFSLPVLIYEGYAFVIPALTEPSVVRPSR